jgi:pimeloyl-ACP methyl ester carboxylesterase
MLKEDSPISFFLLRGLAREIRHWGEFCTLLERTRTEFKVVPLEIPGSGALRTERSPTSIDGYVKALRSQYHHKVEADRINIIFGLSLGGMIASRWTNCYPDDFHGMVLLNTSGRPAPFYKRIRFVAALTLLSAAVHRDPYLREKKIANLVCNLADTTELALKWREIAADAPMSSANILRQLYTAARFSLPAHTTLPTLLLCSTHDRLVAAACSKLIASIWKIPLISHPTAGHDLTAEDPQWCISNIISWLPKVYP